MKKNKNKKQKQKQKKVVSESWEKDVTDIWMDKQTELNSEDPPAESNIQYVLYWHCVTHKYNSEPRVQ